jgi:hypothetical protein
MLRKTGVLGSLAALAFFGAAPAYAQTRAGGEFAVVTYTTNAQGFPSVAMLRDGGFVVVWQSPGQDGSDDGVFGQRFALDGSRAGSEFRVNDFTTGAQLRPQVVAALAGGFVVAGLVGSGDPMAAFSHAATIAQGAGRARVLVNTVTVGSAIRATVAAGDLGGFVVTWAAGDGGLGVLAQRYDASGAPAASSGQHVHDGRAEVPQVAMGRTAALRWCGRGVSQGQPSSGVYAQRFDGTARLGSNSGQRTPPFTVASRGSPATPAAVSRSFGRARTKRHRRSVRPALRQDGTAIGVIPAGPWWKLPSL